MKKDLVYFYDSNKNYHDPLRFSIRSAEKNLDFRHIWIIGKKPEFLNDKVKEIYYEDNPNWKSSKHPKYKYFQREKFQIAVDTPKISRNFVWMNDDLYIMKDIRDVPYHHGGKLKYWDGKRTGYSKKTHGGVWRHIIRKMHNTFPDGYFYELHTPCTFNKAKMREVLNVIDDDLLAMIKSFYCNTYKVGGQQRSDVKVYEDFNLDALKDGDMLSSRDKTEKPTTPLMSILRRSFNMPSSYEVRNDT